MHRFFLDDKPERDRAVERLCLECRSDIGTGGLTVTHTLVKYHTERSKMLKEMGGECAFCHATINLEFHHIDHQGETRVGGWQQLYLVRQAMLDNNILVLCRACHREHHKRYSWDMNYRKAYHNEHGLIE